MTFTITTNERFAAMPLEARCEVANALEKYIGRILVSGPMMSSKDPIFYEGNLVGETIAEK